MPDNRYSSLRIERSGHIVELTLCRPELHNRIDAETHHELVTAFREIEQMDDVRAVVFAAEGKTFSAGGDFELLLAGNADSSLRNQLRDDGWRLITSLVDVRHPIVAAVQGDAVGLGATLALMSDVVVTHGACRLSDPHVIVGLVAGDGGCLAWPLSVGMARAKRHLLTGEPMTGSEAKASGLITDVVESPSDVLPAARALAERIAQLPPLAVRGTKRSLNTLVRLRLNEVMPISLGDEMATFGSDDLREAVNAFTERREGNYHGR